MPVAEKTLYEIPVDGMQNMTTIDFPGLLAAVLFVRGCPWKCRYCHNPKLRESILENSLPWITIESFLKNRLGYLEGVVVSGGEPTMHPKLPELLKLIREMGYKIAIHTNGFYPAMLKKILSEDLVDYIAMDVKAPPRAYDRITQCTGSCLPVSKSIKEIVSAGIDHEFRTTYHPALLSEQELRELMKSVLQSGAKRYYIQRFHKEGVRDEELVNGLTTFEIPESVVALGTKFFREFGVR